MLTDLQFAALRSAFELGGERGTVAVGQTFLGAFPAADECGYLANTGDQFATLQREIFVLGYTEALKTAAPRGVVVDQNGVILALR